MRAAAIPSIATALRLIEVLPVFGRISFGCVQDKFRRLKMLSFDALSVLGLAAHAVLCGRFD